MRGLSMRFYEFKECIEKGYTLKGIIDSKSFKIRNIKGLNIINIGRRKIILTNEELDKVKIYNNMNLNELYNKNYIYIMKKY